AHWLSCMAVLGLPQTIKTDNGPNYRALLTIAFCKKWNINLVHGIPYNSTGQAVVQRAHHT
ncbi:POK6 protein, partial [Centropus bengalensis]|nr:POK6 protein [Centropus bengalensis]